MTSYVDQAVQARISAARAKTQQQRETRAVFARQRAAGLGARHAAKMARWTDEDANRGDIPTVREAS